MQGTNLSGEGGEEPAINSDLGTIYALINNMRGNSRKAVFDEGGVKQHIFTRTGGAKRAVKISHGISRILYRTLISNY